MSNAYVALKALGFVTVICYAFMYGIIALSQGTYSGRLLCSVQDCVRCYSLSVYVNSGTQEVIVTYGVPKCQID